MEEKKIDTGYVVKMNVTVTKIVQGRTVGVYVTEVVGSGDTEQRAKGAAVIELEGTPNRLANLYGKLPEIKA